MKLYFMKKDAIDYMKANIRTLYINYYRYATNEWIYDLFDYEPFEFFMEVPDFELAEIEGPIGEVELKNCKIIYSHLERISASQASDERLWAGLCNGVFYTYLRKRWNYSNMQLKKTETDASAVLSRFFFSGGTRAGLYRNTLSKCWWVGYLTYQKTALNKWELLDELGANDFSTKVSDIFYSNNFSANVDILKGICHSIRFFEEKEIKLSMKEHIRPTLQYLNALGGAALLDIYFADEIKNIIVENIAKIQNGGQSDLVQEEEDNEEDDIASFGNKVEVDYQEYIDSSLDNIDDLDTNGILGKLEEVKRGCTVVTHMMPADKEMIYQIPVENGSRQLYEVEKKMLGKGVGEIVHIGIKSFEIREIHW